MTRKAGIMMSVLPDIYLSISSKLPTSRVSVKQLQVDSYTYWLLERPDVDEFPHSMLNFSSAIGLSGLRK